MRREAFEYELSRAFTGMMPTLLSSKSISLRRYSPIVVL